MPNRIIKDSIRTSKSVNALSDFQFRLWTYLITYVDDYGRGSADPELLKGFVFPRRKSVTEATIQKTLEDLANMGSVILYEVGGEPYLCFPNWSEHQTVRNKVSKFPAPEDGNIRKTSTCMQMNVVECKCSRNPIQTNPNTNTNPIRESDAPAHACERKAYGTFKNVLLSDEEHYKLTERFGKAAAEKLIDSFSCKLESKGYKSENHCATILQWADEDGVKADNTPSGSFDTDEFLEAALKNSFKKEEA